MINLIKLLSVLAFILSFSFGDYFTKKIAEDITKCGCSKQLAIQSVTLLDGSTNSICSLYYLRLASEFNTTAIKIVDRKTIESSLTEIAFSESGIVSEETTNPKSGNFIAADSLLHITVAELEEGTEIFAQLVKVETGAILLSKSYCDFEQKNVSSQDISKQTPNAPIYIPVSEEEKKLKISYDFRIQNNKDLQNNSALRKEFQGNDAIYKAQQMGNKVGLIFNSPKTSTLFIHLYAKKDPAYRERFQNYLSSSIQQFEFLKKENSALYQTFQRMLDENSFYFTSVPGRKNVYENTMRFMKNPSPMKNPSQIKNNGKENPPKNNNQQKKQSQKK